MKDWYSKALGDGVAAFKPSMDIHAAFTSAYIAAGQPIEMAVFSRNDPKANIVTVYFTPSAMVLAKAFGASPCEKPDREGLGLLVGDTRCWQLYYPDSK